MEAPVDGDEGNFLLAIETSEESIACFELRMQKVVRHWVDARLKIGDKNERKNIKRMAEIFVVWEDKLLRRTRGGLRAVTQIDQPNKLLRCIKDELGH